MGRRMSTKNCEGVPVVTLDELFEALTLIQTGKIAHFPVVLLGVDYWRSLVDLLQRMVAAGTISADDLRLMLVTDDLDELVAHLHRHAIQYFGLHSRREWMPTRWLGERAPSPSHP